MAYDLLGRLIERDEPEGLTAWSTDTGAKGIGKLAPKCRGPDHPGDLRQRPGDDQQLRQRKGSKRIPQVRDIVGVVEFEWDRIANGAYISLKPESVRYTVDIGLEFAISAYGSGVLFTDRVEVKPSTGVKDGVMVSQMDFGVYRDTTVGYTISRGKIGSPLRPKVKSELIARGRIVRLSDTPFWSAK